MIKSNANDHLDKVWSEIEKMGSLKMAHERIDELEKENELQRIMLNRTEEDLQKANQRVDQLIKILAKGSQHD